VKKGMCLRVFGAALVLVFLGCAMGLPLAWSQPLSMGRIELKGNTMITGGNGLAFQSPQDTEAPLMGGETVKTQGKSQALFDWKGKGSMVLDENGETVVNTSGFELMKGKLTLRVNAGEVMKVKALGKIYTVQAPAGKVGVATIEIKDNMIKLAGVIFLGGGSGAVVASSTSALLGPALIGGGAIAGITAVAVSESNNGGGTASPSTP